MDVTARSLVGGCLVALLSVVSLAASSGDPRLIEAVKSRDKTAVRSLAAKTDVNAPSPDGATALHWAVHLDDLDISEVLIRAGADPNAANQLGVTALSLACTNANAAMVAMLLRAGASPHSRFPSGETALMTCSRTGSVDAVRALVAHGANVNDKEGSRQQTALMWAIAANHPGIMQFLIEHGADVAARSIGGFTPLLFAAREGDLDSVRTLMAAGASVNDTAADGSAALLVATVRGHVALAQFLLEHGADPNANGSGYTALHWAAGSWETQLTGALGFDSAMGGLKAGKVDLVKALLAHGANPNARVVKNPPRFGFTTFRTKLAGATPFLLAAMAADLDVMRVLVAGGADPLLVMDDKTTPLIVAAGVGQVTGESRVIEASALKAVKLVLELGGDPNAANDAGNTALHGIAYLGWNALVQLLVDNGARVNVMNKRGETPLIIAEGKGERLSAAIVIHKSTADLLRKLGADDKLGKPNMTNAPL